MELPVSEDFKSLLNPFLFVLKEDCFDEECDRYSLQMLQIGHLETLKSPHETILFPLLNATETEVLAHTDISC